MYKLLEGIDAIQLNFSDGGLLYMNITLAAIMFGVALEIKIDNFRRLFKQPKSAFLGIFSQFLRLPALTFALVLLLKPPASVAMGMILIASCPGGNVSNFISSLAKANIELSVSLTAFATLMATLITPLNFAFWGGLYVKANASAMALDQPLVIGLLDTAKIVFILLGIPLILGMLFAHKFPLTTGKILKTVKITSLVLYASFIIGALVANLEHFPGYIWPIALMVLFLNSQTLFTGYLVGTVARVPLRDRRTLTIETGIQNSGLALALILNDEILKNYGGMAFMAAWWGIWQMASGIGIAAILGRLKVPEGAKARFIGARKRA
ncbi:MAG: bile acid:sodium symporter family protein [Bacteroidales bacterium]|jgi:BASS family bile acid:Na+ symporter|nr:bile acid:sodium symporter family protein [Bacteroidales bacterium]